uniref:Uncharacterized protein n=1 Tax=Romanomermis culicivorax TaxID=13658 RepID=A0A915I819_ROMCU
MRLGKEATLSTGRKKAGPSATAKTAALRRNRLRVHVLFDRRTIGHIGCHCVDTLLTETGRRTRRRRRKRASRRINRVILRKDSWSASSNAATAGRIAGQFSDTGVGIFTSGAARWATTGKIRRPILTGQLVTILRIILMVIQIQRITRRSHFVAGFLILFLLRRRMTEVIILIRHRRVIAHRSIFLRTGFGNEIAVGARIVRVAKKN